MLRPSLRLKVEGQLAGNGRHYCSMGSPSRGNLASREHHPRPPETRRRATSSSARRCVTFCVNNNACGASRAVAHTMAASWWAQLSCRGHGVRDAAQRCRRRPARPWRSQHALQTDGLRPCLQKHIEGVTGQLERKQFCTRS